MDANEYLDQVAGNQTSKPFSVEDAIVMISSEAISVISADTSRHASNVAALAAQLDQALARIAAIEQQLPPEAVPSRSR